MYGFDLDCSYGKLVYSNGVFCEFKEVHKIILLFIYNLWNYKGKKDHERIISSIITIIMNSNVHVIYFFKTPTINNHHKKTPSSIITTIMDSNVHVIYFFKTPTINNHHERTPSLITTTIVDSHVHVIYFFKTPIIISHHYSILLCHLSTS